MTRDVRVIPFQKRYKEIINIEMTGNTNVILGVITVILFTKDVMRCRGDSFYTGMTNDAIAFLFSKDVMTFRKRTYSGMACITSVHPCGVPVSLFGECRMMCSSMKLTNE